MVRDLGAGQHQLAPLPRRLLVVQQVLQDAVLLLLLQDLLVLLPLLVLLLIPPLLVHLVHPKPLEVDSVGIRMLGPGVVEADCWPLLEGNLLVVVNDTVPPRAVPR